MTVLSVLQKSSMETYRDRETMIPPHAQSPFSIYTGREDAERLS